MAATRETGSSLQTHEDLTLWKEEQEAARTQRQGSHDLTIGIVWDWVALVAVVSALVVSFLALIGAIAWSGPITPLHVILAIVSGWIGTRLQPSRR